MKKMTQEEINKITRLSSDFASQLNDAIKTKALSSEFIFNETGSSLSIILTRLAQEEQNKKDVIKNSITKSFAPSEIKIEIKP